MVCSHKLCSTNGILTHVPSLCTIMEQRPCWKADRHAAGQEISCNLCDLKVHYHIHQPAISSCPESVSQYMLSYPISVPTLLFSFLFSLVSLSFFFSTYFSLRVNVLYTHILIPKLSRRHLLLQGVQLKSGLLTEP